MRSATILFWDRKLEQFHTLRESETQDKLVRPQPGEEPRARYLLSDGQLLDTGSEGGRLLIPLLARTGLVGTIVLGESRRARRAFHSSEVKLLQDIATRTALAIENHQYQRELIASERMAALGTMAGMLVHDLRGPMTVIRGYAETLLEGKLDEKIVKERAELITRMVDRLEAMTRETLDFARGSGHLVRRAMPMRLLLIELTESLASELPGLEVTRNFELPHDGQAALDVDKLRRVVFNVAANAREAMGGAGTLHIGARLVSGQLEIELRDEGPGVAPELRDRAFEPFVTHGKKGGTGLGLAVARRFVEDHGGTIELAGEGPGACFRIRLPI